MSVPTASDAIKLLNETKQLCARGGFHLHKISSNVKDVIMSVDSEDRAAAIKDLDLREQDLPIENAIGVQWCLESDSLLFRVTLQDKSFTRRGILSTISSIFNPLGLISPILLAGKQILQELCRDGLGWDEHVPEDIRTRWEKWRGDLPKLSTLRIRRCYRRDEITASCRVELHHFSDASQTGYGQCSYLRLIDEHGNVDTSLVMAKSRVTPLKAVTIPRLELTAAVTSVRVSEFLNKELNYRQIENFFWTDSKIVLSYIANESKRFHVFVCTANTRCVVARAMASG